MVSSQDQRLRKCTRPCPSPQAFFSFNIALNASCPFGFAAAAVDPPISTSPPASVLVAGVNAGGAFRSFAPSLDLVDLGLGGGRKRAGSGADFEAEAEAEAAPAGGNRWVAGRMGRRWDSKGKGLWERRTAPTAWERQ